MKKIYLKYNPYTLETELTVDGVRPADNSKISAQNLQGTRLQEWVEDLPEILIDEYKDTDFEVTFHGTLLDFDDLQEVFAEACNSQSMTARLKRIPAKETSDKEVLIDDVFQKIQNGPFDELRSQDIINAFEHAKSSDFEVCVVATMSAGKSTLINSMLGSQLMPSKQEACTAIITRIKDVEDMATWQAEVYDKDNRLMESHNNLTYQTMERLNSDEKVSTIRINGDIPFVKAEDVSLVLIDTPGPNNSRDPEHKRVQSEFLNKSCKSLVLYIMEGTFGSDDDNSLLERVASSMKVGGKQSKDRFIFVVNKMDGRNKNDGETEQTLERVRSYLKSHDIVNPNLFPAAALPALNIQMMQNGTLTDDDELDETEMKIRKLNRNESLHLEKYASLPAGIRGEINNHLQVAKDNGDTAEEALIHTGIPSIEAAIRQYVQKYAKTSKIKNIVDTFTHEMEELKCMDETRKALAQNQEKGEEIAEQLALIRRKIDDGKSAKEFKSSIDNTLKQTQQNVQDVITNIRLKFKNKITEKSDDLDGDEITLDEVEDEVKRLVRFVKKLEPDFEAELDETIQENLVKVVDSLLTEYRKKLASLTDELDLSVLGNITIVPLRLLGGSLQVNEDISTRKLTKTKKVEDGREYVKNTDKKWYKPWTWFQESGYYRTKYKEVKFVPGKDLAVTFFAPIDKGLIENAAAAQKHALQQAQNIANSYSEEFARLDNILQEKLAEMQSYVTEQDKAEERIRETSERLAWLENIQKEVESILDI